MTIGFDKVNFIDENMWVKSSSDIPISDRITTSIFASYINRISVLDYQMQDMMEKIARNNIDSKDLQNIISLINFGITGQKNAESAVNDLQTPGTIAYDILQNILKNDRVNPGGKVFNEKMLVDSFKLSSEKGDNSALERLSQATQSKIQALNSESQNDMMRFQVLSNLKNNAYTLLSNYMSKMLRTAEAIIGNMR